MFLKHRKYVGKARIKERAYVFQDHQFKSWEEANEIFQVYELTQHHKECITYGYGVLGASESYGNGPVFVKNEDLIWQSELEVCL